VSAFHIAATVLIVALLLPGYVCVRARPLDAIVALELVGATTTVVLLCLAEGYHRGIYFNVALIAAVASWIGGLVYVRFLARYL
jgi:multisubunit Na+/H+ antiporter MnhF subunit